MLRRASRFLPSPTALAAGLLLAGPALAGPPWISIELPANPHDRATRGALFVVHAYHHGEGVQYRVVGTAEGLVGGERRSVPITVEATGRAGLYAVRLPDLDDGRWLLVIRLEDGRAGATALVALDGDRQVAGVQVPSRLSGDGWTIPRPVPTAEIDRLLREGGLAAGDVPDGGFPDRAAAGAGLLALLLLPALLRQAGR